MIKIETLGTTTAIFVKEHDDWTSSKIDKFIEFCKKEYPNVVMEFDMREGVKI